jgi:hypothetical protein
LLPLPSGRPRRSEGFTASHSASLNGTASGSDMAAAVMAASSSGIGKMSTRPLRVLTVVCISFHLSAVGFSQADDAAFGRLFGRSVNEHNVKQTWPQGDQPHHADLTVISASIGPNHGISPLNAHCIRKRQAMFCEIGGIFVRIERHIHALL